MKTSFAPRSRSLACTHRRAFTLIELLVAITAGLFVAMGAFALAKQGSRFFQQEARIANAQFAATLGFDRLRADIARAGFMTTPNIRRDPLFCGAIDNNWPAGMASLAAIRILPALPADVQDPGNGLAPQQITMSGSYGSAETFPIRTVTADNSKFQVYLQPNNGAMVRASNGAPEGGAPLADIFKAGRMLRILDTMGHYEFGAIESFGLNASSQMVITLKGNPPIAFRSSGNCGIEGLGVGMQANVVNWIRYEIRNLKAAPPAGYAPLFGEAGAPGDQTRLDLVRVEVDTDGVEIADSLELVAEYAIDLKFALGVVSAYATPGDPAFTQYPLDDPHITDYAYLVTGASAANAIGPHRIRSVRARFAVRSKEIDRAGGVTMPAGSPAGALFRYGVGADGGFARARTLVADIALPNLAGIPWQ
ncbi:MAG TPA: prepilin-type N-terminal cleavage/methylation domain-containing protein [Polyangiaceae bacterium]|nr:prepilin-type N-terminal cleavage/methylation domain-containing protein [Polyangiaceae bacterium]